MEEPTSITPLIAEKHGRIRELSVEVTQLNQELQELSGQREEYIEHMRREYSVHWGRIKGTIQRPSIQLEYIGQ